METQRTDGKVARAGKPRKGGWVEFLREQGPEQTAESIKAAIQAEVLLIHAVSVTDVDWCMSILRDVKRKKGNVESLLDILIPTKQSG